ncbi:MAG: ribonuclease HI [Anaerolineaceae bacterium]
MATKLPQVTVYCDGACSGNPGPGGWGAVLLFDQGAERVLKGGEKETTNNRMELTAALQALRALSVPSAVTIVTDSSYLMNGATIWLPGWKKRNWKRKEGALANVDLWQALDSEMQRHQVRWEWVRGHAGDHYNERADQEARSAVPKA